MTNAPTPSVRTPALNSSCLRPAQSEFKTYSAFIPHDVAPDTIMEPAFWRHYVRLLRPTDVVRCMSEDGAWERWVTVIKPEAAGVIVSKLFHVEHSKASASADGDELLAIKWCGQVLKFAIVNRQTGAHIKDRLYPRAEAEAALSQMRHQRAA